MYISNVKLDSGSTMVTTTLWLNYHMTYQQLQFCASFTRPYSPETIPNGTMVKITGRILAECIKLCINSI